VDEGILLTERMRLEPWDDSHTELLVRLSGLPEVTRFIGDGTAWSSFRATELSTSNREHWRRHGFGWRVAVERETDKQIGLLALSFAGPGSGVEAGEYEIGWWFDPALWGRGLAREGALVVRDEAFTRLDAPSILARVQPANAASLRLAAAIGLTPESQSRGRFGEGIAVLRLMASSWQRDYRS
jgi:RimJ/RimL family protein N-acetyltransferase